MTQVECGQGLSPGGLHGLAPGEAVGKEPETKNQGGIRRPGSQVQKCLRSPKFYLILSKSSNFLSENCPLAIWWTLVTLTLCLIVILYWVQKKRAVEDSKYW